MYIYHWKIEEEEDSDVYSWSVEPARKQTCRDATGPHDRMIIKNTTIKYCAHSGQ